MASTERRCAAALLTVALLQVGAGAVSAEETRRPASNESAAGAEQERRARADDQLMRQKQRVARATVLVRAGDKDCAGSVVGSATHVLTAAHCIPEGLEEVEVVARGRRIVAVVALVDRTRDTALLAVVEPIDVEPLEFDRELPAPGDRVLFVGRPDRRSRAQVARVTHLGRCPSLPGVGDAVFTTVRARPGDSGAPILNESLRVVGVIHGGAACHIAAPTAALARQLGPAEPDASTAPTPRG